MILISLMGFVEKISERLCYAFRMNVLFMSDKGIAVKEKLVNERFVTLSSWNAKVENDFCFINKYLQTKSHRWFYRLKKDLAWVKSVFAGPIKVITVRVPNSQAIGSPMFPGSFCFTHLKSVNAMIVETIPTTNAAMPSRLCEHFDNNGLIILLSFCGKSATRPAKSVGIKIIIEAIPEIHLSVSFSQRFEHICCTYPIWRDG